MIDIAKLLAQRSVHVSVVTTPVNAARFNSQIRRLTSLKIDIFELNFPCSEAGLPEGCESLSPPPSCIVSDISLPYTSNLAAKFGIPRISFHGFSCMCLLSVRMICLHADEIEEDVGSDSDYFVLPGFPDDDELDKLQRGGGGGAGREIVDWLDSKDPNSVIYVCFGSICNLKASSKPFIWAIRETEATKDLYRWMEDDGFEGSVSGRGMLIRGWAPQVTILSHPAGISAGVPLVTWPLFGDQFSNEKLIVEVVKIGVRVGVERPTYFEGKEESGVMVAREQVERAVRLAMDVGEEGEERRKRAKELAEMARRAVDTGGSSWRNIGMLIDDVGQWHQQRMEKLEGDSLER
ncbi:UDP-glycosyltransferase 73C9 [Linum perenne]